MAIDEREAAAMRPGDIEGQRFTIGKRGYEPDEVQRFLHAVADHVGRLQGEIDWQRARVETLEQRALSAQETAYDRISQEFMEVVRRADEAATRVRTRAEEDARAALGGARSDADRMVAQAAGEAERILQTARSEAERLVADATGQVDRLIDRAEAMRRHPTWRDAEQASETRLNPADPREGSDDHRAGVRNGTSGYPADVRNGANGHSASSDYFGAASGQVTLPQVAAAARPGGYVNGGTPQPVAEPSSLPDPVFADFEDFDLNFDRSSFDLFGEPGS